MHEKNKIKSHGGLTKKYSAELAMISTGSLTLEFAIEMMMDDIKFGDSDRAAIQDNWLNGAYLVLQHLEDHVARLESKVNADLEFSDKFKQDFMRDLIEPIKAITRKAREIDDFVINGVIPPGVNQ